MKKISSYILILSTLTLSACGTLTRTHFEQPKTNIPNTWGIKTTGETFANQNNFWVAFNDPQLNDLITRVLSVNNNLALAALNLKKAQLNSHYTATSLVTPSISTEGKVEIFKINEPQENKKIKNDLSNKGMPFNANISLNYELDLWGKLSATKDMEDWEMRATEEDRQAVALEIIKTTANLYWKIAYLKECIVIDQKSIAHAQKNLDIIRTKFKVGMLSKLDMITTEQIFDEKINGYQERQQTLEQTQRNLAILFNQPPQPFVTEYENLSDLALPIVTPDLPAKILANRPDIRAAEYRLRNALINIDRSYASIYPTLTFSDTITISNLLQNPATTILSLLVFPNVDLRARQKDIKSAKIAYEKHVIGFRELIYKALLEVENVLSEREFYLQKTKRLAQTLQRATEAEKLMEIRYRAGKVSLREWLDQQEILRQAEMNVAENHFYQLTNAMKLYIALGGGRLPSIDGRITHPQNSQKH